MYSLLQPILTRVPIRDNAMMTQPLATPQLQLLTTASMSVSRIVFVLSLLGRKPPRFVPSMQIALVTMRQLVLTAKQVPELFTL